MRFSYTGIRVRDLDRSVGFYTRHLGFRMVFRSKVRQTNGEMAVLRDGGDHALELNTYDEGSPTPRAMNSITWPSKSMTSIKPTRDSRREASSLPGTSRRAPAGSGPSSKIRMAYGWRSSR
jgi:catechol 2,3-dioxygenase-like lactoylglutathione lyase family enzyme